MKDDSLSIDRVASKNCVCPQNVFQNGVNTFSKMVKHFLAKRSAFGIFRTLRFVQISPACGPNTYQMMYGQTLNFQCQCQL